MTTSSSALMTWPCPTALELWMAGKQLSVQPTINPTASLRDCKLGAYTEVGPRTVLIEVTMGDYSYVVNDAQITYTAIGNSARSPP
jgi:hypothetical protein